MEFKNRIVEYPNRYKIVKVQGEEEVYDLIRVEGEEYQAGTEVNDTFFNKFALADTVNARLSGKVDKTSIVNSTGTRSDAIISQKTVTELLNKRLPLDNCVLGDIKYSDLSELVGGIYFVTKISGGSEIKINDISDSAFIVVRNPDAKYTFVYSFGRGVQYIAGAVNCSVTSGQFYVFKLSQFNVA